MVQFLKRLLTKSSVFVNNLQNQSLIKSNEQISRYILSKRHFSRSNKTVKYAAYMPAKDGETSVYRTSNLSELDIWGIGTKYVAKPSQRSLLARGDTTAIIITSAGVEVISAPKPHRLHGNIVNWPSDKAKKKMVAIEIANQANLLISPNQPS